MSGQQLVRRSETGLAPLDEARRNIAEARAAQDASTLTEWRDLAEAAEKLQRRRGSAREVADDAGEIRLRCEAALGQIDAEVAPNGVRSDRRSSAHGNARPSSFVAARDNDHQQPAPPLADVRAETRAAWRKLGQLNEGKLDELTEQLRGDEEGGLTTAHAMRALRAGSLAVHTSSARSEWGTPHDLFDELNTEFGFTLDVCSTSELAKCRRFLSPSEDGLSHKWSGVCWMNPPYGDEIAGWIAKAHAEAQRGLTVVCLLPARVDTSWWWEHARRGEVRFLRGRLRFQEADASAPFPSAVVVFRGPRPRARTVYWERRAGTSTPNGRLA